MSAIAKSTASVTEVLPSENDEATELRERERRIDADADDDRANVWRAVLDEHPDGCA